MNTETEDICRLCMSEEDVALYNIFNDQNVMDSTVSKIWDCIGLKVFLGDGLPSLICHRCLYNLDRLDGFRKMCHQSNAHLVKYYSSGSQSAYEDIEDIQDATNTVNSGIGCIVEGSERTVQINPNIAEVHKIDNERYEADIDMSRANLSDINSEDEEEDFNSSHASSSSSMILVKKTYLPRKKINKEKLQELLHHKQCDESLLPTSESHQVLLSGSSGSSQIPTFVKINSGMLMFPNMPILQLRTEGKSIHGNQTSILSNSQAHPFQVLCESNKTDISDSKNDLKKPKKLEIEGKYVKVPHELVMQLSQSAENNPEKNPSMLQKGINSKEIPAKLSDTSEPEIPEIHLKESPSETTSEDDHTCDVCDKVMASKASLFQHYKIHATSANFTLDCPDCNEKFISLIKMEKHMAVHYESGRPFKCTRCKKRFSHSWQSLRHETIHSDVSKFTCKICKRKCTSEAYLNKHMKIHNKEHACDVCNKAFSFAFYLNKHKYKCHQNVLAVNNSVTEDDETVYISDDESRDKDTETNISEIQNSSRNPEVEQIPKQNWEKRVFENQGLQEVLATKKQCKDYVQNEYERSSLKLYTALKDNIKQFSSNVDATFLNNSESSQIRQTTNDLSKSIDVKENMYTCSMCLHIYSNIDELMIHEQTTHNIKKIYTCISCTKMFTRQSYLVVHSKECEGYM